MENIAPTESPETQVFFIYLKFHAHFSEEHDPLLFLRYLRELGKVTVIPHASNVPALEDYDFNQLYLQWTVKLTTDKSQADIEEILASAITDTENTIKIEKVSLPPPDPGLLNQHAEEKPTKMPSTEVVAESSQESTKSIQAQLADNTWFKLGRNIFTVCGNCQVEFFAPDAVHLTQKDEKFVQIQEDIIPLFSLHDLLHLHQTRDIKQMSLLVLRQTDKKRSFLVDEVISPQPVESFVIKEVFSNQPYLSGAVVLENGDIAFQLNTAQLLF